MLPINHYLISTPPQQSGGQYKVTIVDAMSGDTPPDAIPADPPYAPNPFYVTAGDLVAVDLSLYGNWTLDGANAVTSIEPDYTNVPYDDFGDYCSFTMPAFDVYVWAVSSW